MTIVIATHQSFPMQKTLLLDDITSLSTVSSICHLIKMLSIFLILSIVTGAQVKLNINSIKKPIYSKLFENGFQYAAANQANCTSIFTTLRSNLLSIETWSRDSRSVLNRLYEAIDVAGFTDVQKNVHETIYKAQQKYLSVIDSKSEANIYATLAIKNCTIIGIDDLDTLIEAGKSNLVQSYHDAVHVFSRSQRSADDLRNPLLMPIYSIKTDFMRECRQSFKAIHQGVNAVKGNMHRIHETFTVDPSHVENVPNSYIPIIEPFVLTHLFFDFIDLKENGEENSFTQLLIANATDSFKFMAANVNGQIDDSSYTIETFLNATTALTSDIRSGLIDRVREKTSNGQMEIDELIIKAQQDIKSNLPETYNVEEMSHLDMATVVQETLEGFAEKSNEIAFDVINDFVNLFEFLLEIAG